VADELSTAVSAIQTKAATITGIKGVSRGEPVGGPKKTPWAAVFLKSGGSEKESFKYRGENHTATIRIYLLVKHETDEATLEKMWHRTLTVFDADQDLGGAVLDSNISGYETGFQEVADNTFRIIDIFCEFQIWAISSPVP